MTYPQSRPQSNRVLYTYRPLGKVLIYKGKN